MVHRMQTQKFTTWPLSLIPGFMQGVWQMTQRGRSQSVVRCSVVVLLAPCARLSLLVNQRLKLRLLCRVLATTIQDEPKESTRSWHVPFARTTIQPDPPVKTWKLVWMDIPPSSDCQLRHENFTCEVSQTAT